MHSLENLNLKQNRNRTCALMMCVVIFVAAPGFADLWYQHYAKAERALVDEDWNEAILELNSALEKRGESGAHIRSYGMRVVDYFPYLKLGIAYYHLGHTDSALRAFETERNFGAIQEIATALAVLEEFEGLARQVLTEKAAAEQLQINNITEAGIEMASGLMAEGRYDEATSHLLRVISVEPDHQIANSMLEEVRLQIAEVEKDRITASKMLERARALTARGATADAKNLVNRAREINDLPEAQKLLSEIEALISETPESSEPVVALEPVSVVDVEAAVEAEIESNIDSELQASIERWLEEADRAFDANRFDDSAFAANRVLALDSLNERAAKRIAAAYQKINQGLLSVGTPIPPAIRFTNRRLDAGDGSRAEIIDQPMFTLHGVVIDPNGIELKCLEPEGVETTVTSQGSLGVVIFSLEYKVAAGSTDFVVQAKNRHGLVTTAEYRVIYRRPWLQSPWLWLTSLLALISLVMVINLRRLERRRFLLKRRFNPYIAGSPVRDETMFFGREALIDRILQTIHNNSVLVFGERRIGKTSLQHQLKSRLETVDDPEFEFFPVFVDLQGVPEQKFFSTIAAEVRQELGGRIGYEDVENMVRREEDFDYREFVRDFRSVLNALEKTTAKRVRLVLLIDEVDELNGYDQRVSQRLRSLFMKSFAESLVAVVSGVRIKRDWDGEGSPWYNFFEEVEIQGIDKQAAEQLIRAPINDVFKVDDGVVERIVELTGCRPYQIQRICVALVNRMHEKGGHRVKIDDIDEVMKSIS